MADLTISANIQFLAGTSKATNETADEAIAENDIVFKITSSGTGTVGNVKRCINTSEEAATFYGIAVQASKSGGVVPVVQTGSFEVDSATFTAGRSYVVGATAGKMSPDDDLAATEHFGLVGCAYEDDQFVLTPKYIGLVA